MEPKIKEEIIEDTELEDLDADWDSKAEGTNESTIGYDSELSCDPLLNSDTIEDIHDDMESEVFIEVQPIEDDMASDPLWLLATVEEPSAQSLDDMIEIKVEPGLFSDKSSENEFNNILTLEKTSCQSSLKETDIEGEEDLLRDPKTKTRTTVKASSVPAATCHPTSKSCQKEAPADVISKPSKTRPKNEDASPVSGAPASSGKTTNVKPSRKKTSGKVESGSSSGKSTKTKPNGRNDVPSVSGTLPKNGIASNPPDELKALTKIKSNPSSDELSNNPHDVAASAVSGAPASSRKSTTVKPFRKKTSVKIESGSSSGESTETKPKGRNYVPSVSGTLPKNGIASNPPNEIKALTKIKSNPSSDALSNNPHDATASAVSGAPAGSIKSTNVKPFRKKTSVKIGSSSGESIKTKHKGRNDALSVSDFLTKNGIASKPPDEIKTKIKSNPSSDELSNSPQVATASAVSDAPAATVCVTCKSFQKATAVKVEPDPPLKKSLNIKPKMKGEAPSVYGTSAAIKSTFKRYRHEKATVKVESAPLRSDSSKTISKGECIASSTSGVVKVKTSKPLDEIKIKVESDTLIEESSNAQANEKEVVGSLTNLEPPSNQTVQLKIKIKTEPEPSSKGSQETEINAEDKVSGVKESTHAGFGEQTMTSTQASEKEVIWAKACIKKIAASVSGEDDVYTEFETMSAHPQCKYTLEELKLMAKRIPACLGDEHCLTFIRECYKSGRDPNTWEWALYSEIEPDEQPVVEAKPHPKCKLTRVQLKNMSNRVLKGDKRGTFMILTYHRGVDPIPLLRNLKLDKSPPWCGWGFRSGKLTCFERFSVMSRGLPHVNCKYTLQELKRMAKHIPDSFGISTRMKFIYRCYKYGKQPAIEDWTRYNVDPYYESEDLFPNKHCKYSVEELKRMADQIPESFGLETRAEFFYRCFIKGKNPAKEDWTQYSSPFTSPSDTPKTGRDLYSEFKDTPAHKNCKHTLEKVIVIAEQLPRSYGTETRTHFVRRCYKFGHAVGKDQNPMVLLKYFDPAAIYPPVNADNPYAEFDNVLPHQNCKLSLEEIKRLAEQIPERFGIEVRVKFIRRCYNNGKDPVAEDWTEYNLDPYFEIKERPVHKGNKFAYKGLKKIASRQIPEYLGILPRLIFVHRCYNLGKNPDKENWREYKPEHFTLADSQSTSETGNTSQTPPDDPNPFAEFNGMPRHPKCKHSLEEIKRMAERIPESLGIQTRVHFVRRCYRFGHNPVTENWALYFRPLKIFPPVNACNPYAEFKDVKPHEDCKLSLEDLWRVANQFPPSFGIETRVKFIRRCYRYGKDPSVEDWTQYNVDPFSEFEEYPPHKACKYSLEELKQMSERIPESLGTHTRVHFVRQCYRRGNDPSKEDWRQYKANLYYDFEESTPHEDCKHSLEELKQMAERIPETFGDEARLHFVRRCYKDGKDPAKEDWKQYPSVCSKLAVLGGSTLEKPPVPTTAKKNGLSLLVKAARKKCKTSKKQRRRAIGTSLADKKIHDNSPQNNYGIIDSSKSVSTSENVETLGCSPQKSIKPSSHSQGNSCPQPGEGSNVLIPPTHIVNNPYVEFDRIPPHPNCKHSLEELKNMAERLPESLGMGARIHFVRECYQFGKPRVLQMGQSAPHCNNSVSAPYNINGSVSLCGPTLENASFAGGLNAVQNQCLAGPGTAWNHHFNEGGPMLTSPPDQYPTVGAPFYPSFPPPPAIIETSYNHPVEPFPSDQSFQFISPPIVIPPNNAPALPTAAGPSLPSAPPFLGDFHSNYSATPSLPTGNQLSIQPTIVPGTLSVAPPPNVATPARDSALHNHPSRRHQQHLPTYDGDAQINFTSGNIPHNSSIPPQYLQFPPEMSNPNNHVTVDTCDYINQTDSSKLAEPGSNPSSVGLKRKSIFQRDSPPKRPAISVEPPKMDLKGSTDTNPLFIVPYGYPIVRLTEEQMDMIENGILEAILEIDDGPTFSESFRCNGQYGFICADGFTRNWLSRFLSTFRPWPGAYLMILSNKSRKVHANAVLPLCKDDDDQILKFIDKQNGRLNTNEWKVVERWDASDFKTCMTLMVDEESAKSLEVSSSIRFKLGSGKISVTRENTKVEPMQLSTPPPEESSLQYESMKLSSSHLAASVVSSCFSNRLTSLHGEEKPKDCDMLESGLGGVMFKQGARGDQKNSGASTHALQHSAESPSPDKSSLKYELMKLNRSRRAAYAVSSCSSSRLPPSLHDEERPQDWDVLERGSDVVIPKQNTVGDRKRAHSSTRTLQHSTRSPSPDKSSLKYELLKLKASLPSDPSCTDSKDGSIGRESSWQNAERSHGLVRLSPSSQCSIQDVSSDEFNYSSSESTACMGDKHKRNDHDRVRRSSSERLRAKREKNRRRRRLRPSKPRRHGRSKKRASSREDRHRGRRQSIRTRSPDRSKVLKLEFKASLKHEVRRMYSRGDSSEREKRDRDQRRQPSTSSKRSKRMLFHDGTSRSSSDLAPSLQDVHVREDNDPLGIRSRTRQSSKQHKSQPGRTMERPIRPPSPDVYNRSEGECTPSPTPSFGNAVLLGYPMRKR